MFYLSHQQQLQRYDICKEKQLRTSKLKEARTWKDQYDKSPYHAV